MYLIMRMRGYVMGMAIVMVLLYTSKCVKTHVESLFAHFS